MIRMFSGFCISNCDCGWRLFATIEHTLRQAIRVVAHLFTVVQQVCTNDLRGRIRSVVDVVVVNTDLIRAFSRVKFSLFLTNTSIVYDHIIEMNLGRVLLDRLEMLARAVAVSLTGLCHQVIDEDLGCPCLPDYPSHLRYEQVRQDACVERTRTNRDHVSRANRFQRLRQGNALFGFEPQTANRKL